MRASARRGGVAVVVFARAPVAGRAKTRLAARLGDAGAARLQARLTENAVRAALAARLGAVELHVIPRVGHAAFRRLRRRYRIVLRLQRGRDLGERMLNALRAGLRGWRYVVLIGSDCPALTARDILRAVCALRSGCAVAIAPAEDGGYALIALRRVSARIFEGLEWGGAEVFAQTRTRLASLGWRWRELRRVWDVDRPADVDRYRSTTLKRKVGASHQIEAWRPRFSR